jgi:transcriptional regulator with XRE-family HTH domain
MDKKHLAEIGHRLRQRRTELNMTREEFSELADISTGYYGQLEVGTSQMSIDTLIKVAHTSRLSLEEILFGSGREAGNPSTVLEILNKCTPRELKLAEKLLKLYLLKAPDSASTNKKTCQE